MNMNSVQDMQKRNSAIDLLKFILSFLVVCIHVPFQGAFGEYFVVLCRIAVPLFFIISGYFYKPVKAPKQIKRYLLMAIGVELLYCSFNGAIQLLSDSGSIVNYLIKDLNVNTLIKFVLFNKSIYTPHGWYLFALVYVYVFMWLIDKTFHNKQKRSIFFLSISLLLLSVNIVVGDLSFALFGAKSESVLVRNWLFTGVPFFAIGRLIKDKEVTFDNVSLLGISSLIFIVFGILEVFFFKKWCIYSESSCLNLFVAIAAVLLFCATISCKLKVPSILSRIFPGGYCLDIYIYHNLLLTIVTVVARKVGVYSIIEAILPIVVFVTTLLFSVLKKHTFPLIKAIKCTNFTKNKEI